MSSVETETSGPDLERRRRNAGGPIEDDEIARQKMRDAKVFERGGGGIHGDGEPPYLCVGFDPDNVEDAKSGSPFFSSEEYDTIKPMAYFAGKGDLLMMRWLYVNGADTRDEELLDHYPMLMAARSGQIEVCKWLFAHGAAGDVKRRIGKHSIFDSLGRSALASAFGCDHPNPNLCMWLILNGALCTDDDSGNLGVEIMRQDLDPKHPNRHGHVKEREALLEWANDLHRARTSFRLFLSGALPPPEDTSSTHRSVSFVQPLDGEPGIRRLIGDYDGFVRGRQARIVRKLTELLPEVFPELDAKQAAQSTANPLSRVESSLSETSSEVSQSNFRITAENLSSASRMISELSEGAVRLEAPREHTCLLANVRVRADDIYISDEHFERLSEIARRLSMVEGHASSTNS